jgi:hypothetical protein
VCCQLLLCVMAWRYKRSTSAQLGLCSPIFEFTATMPDRCCAIASDSESAMVCSGRTRLRLAVKLLTDLPVMLSRMPPLLALSPTARHSA